ncbi:MAG: helix-turn-helix domain-containing protein [Paenibacillaceae bacterium]|nr:helix-turn-helix domain-containing protein [Paenibacillaceae bacterium]
MWRFGNSTLFLRHFLSYLTLLILPIIVVGIVLYSNFVHLLTTQSNDNYRKMLEQVSRLMDTKLLELTEITLKIATKPELSAASLRNFYEVYRVSSALSFQEGNSFIDNFAIFIRGGDYIYTSQTTYTLPVFFQFYGYDDPQRFLAELNDIRHPMMRVDDMHPRSSTGTDKYFTFLKPVPLNSSQPYGTAMFIVREQSIRDMYRTVLTYKNSNVMILNEDRQPITALDTAPTLDAAQIELLLRHDDKEGTKELTVNGQSFFVSYVSSNLSNWTYITMVPKAVLMESVNQVKGKALIALMIILVAGAAIIYLTMYLNYNPVKKLFRLTEHLRQQVENSRPALKKSLLMDLIQGHYTEKEEFNLLAASSGIRLEADSYHIVLIDLSQTTHATKEQCLRFWNDKLASAALEFHLAEGLEPGKIGCIVGSDHHEGERLLPWSDWIRQFEAAFAQTPSIGIGTGYEDLSQLGKSYLEAVTALQYQYVLGSGQVFLFGDRFMEIGRTKVPYPAQSLESLEFCLKEGNESGFNKVLDHLIAQIMQADLSLVMAKYVYLDLISLLFKRAVPLLFTDGAFATPMLDIVKISQLTSKTELKQLMLQAGAHLLQQISEYAPDSSKEKDIGKDMQHYVDQHYRNYSFSLQMMADYFNVTPSYMSKSFKARTGVRLSDYLHQKRMDEARELLLRTDMSLQDIVEQIGYSDVSSFIRKFKLSFGMPPGEFRKDMKSEHP